MSDRKFSDTFIRVSTEKAHSLSDSGCYVFVTRDLDVRKPMAAFLFKKEFGVYPSDVRLMRQKKTRSIRTKVRASSKTYWFKKFYFQVPEGTKIENKE